MNSTHHEFSWDIAHADRAWHALEAEQAAEAAKAGQPESRLIDIVDVDVLPRHDNPMSFADRSEVRTTYEGFLCDPRLADAPEFTRRRVTAQLFHLELLEGGKTDVYQHAETAMNSELKLVDEDEIDRRQEALENELSQHGLGFDKSYAEAFRNQLGVKPSFRDRLGIGPHKRAMKRHLIAFARRTGALAVGEDPANSLAVPQIVSKKASWVGYCGTDDTTGEPFTQINAHKRHGYIRGRAAAIAAHEGRGHAMDIAQKRTAILHGDTDPLFGITNIFTPENVTAETIALGREQQILRNVQGEDAWEYHLQADYHDYFEMVWNNALIYINTGRDQAAVVEYVQDRLLPYEKLAGIEGHIKDIRDDPAWRANTTAYEPAMRVVRKVLERPLAEQEAFFRQVGRYPYSEAQMHALLSGQSHLVAA